MEKEVYVRLTLKRAKAIAIELWTWLAETGDKDKSKWSGWKKYGRMDCDCSLCEYSKRRSKDILSCLYCPYKKQFYGCLKPGSPYARWSNAKTARGREKYAVLFLEQLKQL